MVSWLVGVSLLLHGFALTASTTSCENFTEMPVDVVEVEGGYAVFLCGHCEVRVIQWSVNGTSVKNLSSPYVTQDVVTYPDGTVVFRLTIDARPELNGTVVQCQAFFYDGPWYINATFFVKAPPGPVSNLRLHSTTREIVLTWDQPNLTDNSSVCVDVYLFSKVEEQEQVDGMCDGNMSTYTLDVIDPDPEVPYQFVVTTQYVVRGAKKNGSQSNATGYFLGEPKAISGESIECQVIHVALSPNLWVSMKVLVRNVVAWISTGRKVDSYRIEVVIHDNEAPHRVTQLTVCPVPPDSIRIENSTIYLSADCPNLPAERFGSASLTATNGVGSVNVPIKYPISTHFIQAVSARPCSNTTQLCQLRVSLTYVVDIRVAKGSLVVVHEGWNDIQYFVGSRGEGTAMLVNGLKGGNYSLAVFTLGGNGMPSEFPANPPIVVNNIPVPPTVHEDIRVEHLKNVDLQADGACFTCHFYSDSLATHCAVILHTLPQSPAEQIRTKSYKFPRNGDEARGCIDTKPGQYGMVTFGYLNMALNGRPLNIGIKSLNTGDEVVTTAGVLPVTVGTIVPVAVAVFIFVICLVVVKCRSCSANPQSEAENGQPHHSKESGSNAGQDQADKKYLSTLTEAIGKKNQSDSGMYSKSTSLVEENADVGHCVATGGDEGAEFQDATRCERASFNDGQLLVKETEDEDQIETSQREVHTQETEPGDGRNYAKEILPTLTNDKDVPSTGHVPTQDDFDDSIAGDANTSAIKLFSMTFSTENNVT